MSWVCYLRDANFITYLSNFVPVLQDIGSWRSLLFVTFFTNIYPT
jgi:hypothetical protein